MGATPRTMPVMTAPLTPADLGTILSVWAHPDDETYLAGATMATAAGRNAIRSKAERVVAG